MISYTDCRLCGRQCGRDRTAGETGFCHMGATPVLARAALHFWEEPPISGTRGSGAIFFSGCSLGCLYCQNREISRTGAGVPVSEARLAELMLSLAGQGAHNIDLVTPTHFAPSVIAAVAQARERGLRLPVVYNTGSYDTQQTVEALRHTVDIYLPDLKYARAQTAAALSAAPDLVEVSRAAIEAMVRQVGPPVLDAAGMMQRGVIVRLLLLPGHLAEAKLSLSYLYRTYGNDVFISLMNQYTPMPGMSRPLDRRVTRAEYRELIEFADRLGVTQAFVQEEGCAEESFIPPFDRTGL